MCAGGKASGANTAKTSTPTEAQKKKAVATKKSDEKAKVAAPATGASAVSTAPGGSVHAGEPLPADLQAHLDVLSYLEATLLKDLDKLDDNARRYRVVHRAAE